MTTTQILASLIGVYFIAAGTGLLVDRNSMKEMFDELKTQRMLGYLAGVVAFSIGGGIVAIHNDWSGLLAGFVSLVGWMALVEGALLLAFRERFLAVFDGWWLSKGFLTGMGVATLIAGLALVISSFS